MTDKRICGAKTRSGGKCQNSPMPNGKCRLHGGMSLGGVNSPAFKHGRHSKYLPKGLLEQYKTALADPDLLNLHDEIALIDARLAQVLAKIEAGGESAEAWERLQSEFAVMLETMQSIPALSEKLTGEKSENIAVLQFQPRKPKKLQLEKLDENKAGEKLLESLTTMGNMITGTIENRAAWEDVQGLVEQRRKLVESERKWYIENQQVITAERALLLIAAIADIIRQHVTDERIKRSIIENINRLAIIET